MKITRNDLRYVGSNHPNIRYRAWLNDVVMGGWLGDDKQEFYAALADDLDYIGEADSIHDVTIAACGHAPQGADPMPVDDFSSLDNFLDKPCLIVLIGVSGSGKSTLAKRLSRNDYDVVSTDHYRGVYCGDPSLQSVNSKIFPVIHDIVRTRCQHGQRTIVDATNLEQRYRRFFWDANTLNGLPSYAIIVDASHNLCVARQQTRKRKVPEYAIRRQYNVFSKVPQDILGENWSRVFKIDPFYEVVELGCDNVELG